MKETNTTHNKYMSLSLVLLVLLTLAIVAVPVAAEEPIDQDQDGYYYMEGDCDDTNPDIHPGAVESCNGIDDNCDDSIDEGVTQYCGQGQCMGIQLCLEGAQWSACSTEGTDAGICAACDASGNEVFDPTQNIDCLENGYQGFSACDTELDANPFTLDSLIPFESTCQDLGICSQGTYEYAHACSIECGAECIIESIESEPCGQTDEGECALGTITRACTESCTFGEWGECEGAIYPTEETCDGLDNDCDGLIDEDLTMACGEGACEGTMTCIGSNQWSTCSTEGTDAGVCAACGPEGQIVYDETQNSDCSQFSLLAIDTCSYSPDENPLTRDFAAGFTSVCSAIDSCSQGTYEFAHSCDVDACGAECDEANACADTTCSETYEDYCSETFLADYNDNGAKDNLLVEDSCANSCQDSCLCTDCETDCSATAPTLRCVVGECGAECLAEETESRSCGQTDEGECILGTQARTCTESCTFGGWGECEGAIYPAEETCDGLDNDCDGLIDEELTMACGEGACAGTSTCSMGIWSDCSTSGEDAGVCSICDQDGLVIYDSTQNTDCSEFSLLAIHSCSNEPDGNPLTWDTAAGFTSVCSGIGSCTQDEYDYTHACDVDACGAECDEANACADTTCSEVYDDYCSEHYVADYNDNGAKDNLLVEDSCANSCQDSCLCTDCETDCSAPAPELRCMIGQCGAECVESPDCANKCVGDVFYSQGACGACTCSYDTTDCAAYTGWYDMDKFWVVADDCSDKELINREYRQYSCSVGGCEYVVTETATPATGKKRSHEDGLLCELTPTSKGRCAAGVCATAPRTSWSINYPIKKANLVELPGKDLSSIVYTDGNLNAYLETSRGIQTQGGVSLQVMSRSGKMDVYSLSWNSFENPTDLYIDSDKLSIIQASGKLMKNRQTINNYPMKIVYHKDTKLADIYTEDFTLKDVKTNLYCITMGVRQMCFVM